MEEGDREGLMDLAKYNSDIWGDLDGMRPGFRERGSKIHAV